MRLIRVVGNSLLLFEENLKRALKVCVHGLIDDTAEFRHIFIKHLALSSGSKCLLSLFGHNYNKEDFVSDIQVHLQWHCSDYAYYSGPVFILANFYMRFLILTRRLYYSTVL